MPAMRSICEARISDSVIRRTATDDAVSTPNKRARVGGLRREKARLIRPTNRMRRADLVRGRMQIRMCRYQRSPVSTLPAIMAAAAVEIGLQGVQNHATVVPCSDSRCDSAAHKGIRISTRARTAPRQPLRPPRAGRWHNHRMLSTETTCWSVGRVPPPTP